MSNPYAFFVGCPRSGTTLLGRLGNAHPELAVIHESRWIPRTFERRVGLTPDGHVTAGLLEPLRETRVLKAHDTDEQELEELVRRHTGTPFASFVAALFDLYGERHGKRLVADKSPGYVRYLSLLHELWPQARLAHILRDGREVCLSVLDWRKGVTRFSTFDDDPFTTIGVWWEWYVRLGLEQGRALGAGLYHEIRYESLVAEPELECRRLCEFLGIPYEATMLRFHEGRTRSEPGLSVKSAWLPVTAGLRDWRTELDADDVLRFEAAAGGLMDELGYERAAAFVPRRERARAARIRETFMREARARGRPVPRAWSTEVLASYW